MNNLTTLYNIGQNIIEPNENSYLTFYIGESKYAINIKQIVEIMKLPLLDYPQKLANNIVGLLNYNNFTINILDLRFYLDIKVTPYSIANQLLVVRTDEAIFGLIIDKIDDIISFDPAKMEYFQFSNEEKIIKFLYKQENETVAVINLDSLENTLKKGVAQTDIDIPSLFPHDDDSRYKLMQRNLALTEKSQLNLITNAFTQDKFISFSLNENNYCINLEYVKEFLKNVSMTQIPCNLDYIAGIITLRGDFVTVVDLKKFLKIEISEEKNTEASRNNIIIVESQDFSIGFLVDEIFSIIDIPEDLMNENSYRQFGKNVLSEVILEDKLYTILNMKTILSDERFFVED